MHKLLVVAIAVALTPGAVALAQTGTNILTPIILFESPYALGARAGLMQTPVGALPPITTSTIAGEIQKSVIFSVRYGYVAGSTDFSFNNGAVTATLPLSMGSTISLTGGVVGCNACGTGFMTGLSGDIRVREVPFDGMRLMFALKGDLGYGWSNRTALSDGSVYSAAIQVPISVLFSARNPDAVRFVPWFAPGFGFGSASGVQVFRSTGPAGEVGIVTENASGTRFILGGGFAIYRRTSNLALNFGAQYIPTQSSNVAVGLGLNYGGR